jgi:hypothetical protein
MGRRTEMKNLFARISDNVLDEKDWGVVLLVLHDGVVVEQRSVSQGVYAPESFVLMTVAQLAEWTCYDATGTHPEQYHELAEAERDDEGNRVPGTFRDFWTVEEIRS